MLGGGIVDRGREPGRIEGSRRARKGREEGAIDHLRVNMISKTRTQNSNLTGPTDKQKFTLDVRETRLEKKKEKQEWESTA